MVRLDSNLAATYLVLEFEQTGDNGVGFFLAGSPGVLTCVFMPLAPITPFSLVLSTLVYISQCQEQSGVFSVTPLIWCW